MNDSRPEMSHTPIAQPSSPWDEWPKWDSNQEFCTKRFQFIGSVNQFDKKTQGDKIAILKHRQFIEIYKKLLSEQPLNILELGYFQGVCRYSSLTCTYQTWLTIASRFTL